MKKSVKRGVAIVVAAIAVSGLMVGVKALNLTVQANKITNIELVDGQTVYAAPGAQFIVRTGKAIAVSNDKVGIPDVTAGQDLLPGTLISDNHLLIFSKDTRGVKADPETDNEIWIAIRGSFTVYDANGRKVTPISE